MTKDMMIGKYIDIDDNDSGDFIFRVAVETPISKLMKNVRRTNYKPELEMIESAPIFGLLKNFAFPALAFPKIGLLQPAGLLA